MCHLHCSYRNKLQNKCIEVSGPWQLSLLYLVCRSASRTPEDRKDRQAWVELNIRKSELPSGGWWCHAVSGRSRSRLLSSCEASIWKKIKPLATGSVQIRLRHLIRKPMTSPSHLQDGEAIRYLADLDKVYSTQIRPRFGKRDEGSERSLEASYNKILGRSYPY